MRKSLRPAALQCSYRLQNREKKVNGEGPYSAGEDGIKVEVVLLQRVFHLHCSRCSPLLILSYIYIPPNLAISVSAKMLDKEKTLGVSIEDRTSLDSLERSLGDSGKTHTYETKLNVFDRWASKLNAETKGVDVVLDEEKTDTSVWNAASMWLSANLVIATFSLGALGITVYGLSYFQCVMIIIFFSFMGAAPTAFFSIFGCRLGLRQMIVSKYLVGNYGMRIFAFINMIACIGWGAVNIMASAQLLTIVNNGALPPWGGCLILVVCTILVSFFGYHVIHYYERWAWIPNMAIFIAIICRMAMAKTFTWGETKGGQTVAGNVLSFGGTVFGFTCGWTTFASDYTAYQPRNANPYRIFFGILAGLWTPLCFVLLLGAACATGTLTNDDWKTQYEEHAVGGLVYSILVENSLHGFGQFLCVLLALSTVANNIPNMYSIGMSAQAFSSYLKKVPRVVWTVGGNFITLAICIPAYYHFESVMENFMNLIGYYLSIYLAMSFSQHFIWNKGRWSAYDYMSYMDKNAYPVGLAGIFGFCCGAAGVVLGMNQQWYSGVIGRRIGERGGDIGFELAATFAFIGFNLMRPIEIRYLGR